MEQVLEGSLSESKGRFDMKNQESLSILIGIDNPSARRIADDLASRLGEKFRCNITDNHKDLAGGNVLLALSYPRKVPMEVWKNFDLSLVSHASDLPKGRGWSPANWSAEKLSTEVCLTILEMADRIDEGRILCKTRIDFPIWMLWTEFSRILEIEQINLLELLLAGEWRTLPRIPQTGEPSYFPKRTTSDVELDPAGSIASQWGKVRSSDPVRFPNHFRLHGKRYNLVVERLDD